MRDRRGQSYARLDAPSLRLEQLSGIYVALASAQASADVELGAPTVVIDFSEFIGTGFAP